MQTYLLQDWTCVGGDASANTKSVVQPAAQWLDLAHGRDVAFYLEVAAKDATDINAILMRYETAPYRDSNQFRELTNRALTVGTTPDVARLMLNDNPAVALGRWVRWRLTYTGAGTLWSATFRITVLTFRR